MNLTVPLHGVNHKEWNARCRVSGMDSKLLLDKNDLFLGINLWMIRALLPEMGSDETTLLSRCIDFDNLLDLSEPPVFSSIK